jgi:hypothetical protein
MTVFGNAGRQACGERLYSRAKNSHKSFIRPETGMAGVGSIDTWWVFASHHASVLKLFLHKHHLFRRETFKQTGAAALDAWWQFER